MGKPGSWTVVALENGRLAVYDENDKCLTSQVTAGVAFLIASAPELLAALQACVKKGSKWHPADPVVQAARSAIYRATGEDA